MGPFCALELVSLQALTWMQHYPTEDGFSTSLLSLAERNLVPDPEAAARPTGERFRIYMTGIQMGKGSLVPFIGQLRYVFLYPPPYTKLPVGMVTRLQPGYYEPIYQALCRRLNFWWRAIPFIIIYGANTALLIVFGSALDSVDIVLRFLLIVLQLQPTLLIIFFVTRLFQKRSIARYLHHLSVTDPVLKSLNMTLTFRYTKHIGLEARASENFIEVNIASDEDIHRRFERASYGFSLDQDAESGSDDDMEGDAEKTNPPAVVKLTSTPVVACAVLFPPIEEDFERIPNEAVFGEVITLNEWRTMLWSILRVHQMFYPAGNIKHFRAHVAPVLQSCNDFLLARSRGGAVLEVPTSSGTVATPSISLSVPSTPLSRVPPSPPSQYHVRIDFGYFGRWYGSPSCARCRPGKGLVDKYKKFQGILLYAWRDEESPGSQYEPEAPSSPPSTPPPEKTKKFSGLFKKKESARSTTFVSRPQFDPAGGILRQIRRSFWPVSQIERKRHRYSRFMEQTDGQGFGRGINGVALLQFWLRKLVFDPLANRVRPGDPWKAQRNFVVSLISVTAAWAMLGIWSGLQFVTETNAQNHGAWHYGATCLLMSLVYALAGVLLIRWCPSRSREEMQYPISLNKHPHRSFNMVRNNVETIAAYSILLAIVYELSVGITYVFSVPVIVGIVGGVLVVLATAIFLTCNRKYALSVLYGRQSLDPDPLGGHD